MGLIIRSHGLFLLNRLREKSKEN